MKIWILEIGEPLPLERGARLLRYGLFTKYLASVGHEVVWWASNFSHIKKRHFSKEDKDISYGDVTLRLINGPGYKKNISLKRILHARYFSKRFTELSSKYAKPDLVICPVPTLENANSAIKFSMENEITSVIDFRDLWPDELVEIVPNILKPIARVCLSRMYQDAEFVCKNANGIMGVSKSYLDSGTNLAGRSIRSSDCVFPLPIGYSIDQMEKGDLQQGLRWYEGLNLGSNDFVICFFGTMGQYFDISTVIKCARNLRSNPRIKFILGGDGRQLLKFKKEAADLENILFPGWLDQNQIAAVMLNASIGLAPYKKDANMSLPNKVFDYLNAGLPIVSSLRGELEDLLTTFQSGYSYVADSDDSLIRIILRFFESPDLVQSMGNNARTLFEERFETKKTFELVESYLSRLVGEHRNNKSY